jgi:hypothetical protein
MSAPLRRQYGIAHLVQEEDMRPGQGQEAECHATLLATLKSVSETHFLFAILAAYRKCSYQLQASETRKSKATEV